MTTNRKPAWYLIPGDWIQLQRIINELGWRVLPSDTALWDLVGGNVSLHSGSLVLPGLAGVLKATAGVVSSGATTSDLPEGTRLYYTDTRARASISESVTGLDYTSSTGVLSLTTGYVIPTTTEESAWNAAAGISHAAVTLAASADVLLGLSGQELSLDTQTATYVLAGPTTGVAAAPTFRALLSTDIPALAYQPPLSGSISGTTNQVVVSANSNSVASNITLSLPQDINTTSSPTFLGLTCDTRTLFVDSTNHRVGIGTATPLNPLSVYSTAANSALNIEFRGVRTTSANQAVNIWLRHSHGTIASPTATQSGDLLGVLGCAGCGTTGMINTLSTTIRTYAAETFTDTAYGAHLDFWTIPIGGSAANTVQRMRISADGNVGIGVNVPNELLEVNGKIRALTAFNLNGTDGVSDATAGVPTALTVAGGIITAVTKNDWLNQSVKTGANPVFASSTLYAGTSTITGMAIGELSSSPVYSRTVANGGTGYTVGDVLTLVGGTGTPATYYVSVVSGGVITGTRLIQSGNYTVFPTNPVATTGGTGSNATFNITWDTHVTSLFSVNTTPGTSYGCHFGHHIVQSGSTFNVYKDTTLPGSGWGHLALVCESTTLAANIGGVLNFGGLYRYNVGRAAADWAGIAGLKENATDDNYSGFLSFSTRANGTPTSEKMRINSVGKVGIGTTAPNELLEVNGKIRALTAFNLNGTDGLASQVVILAKLTTLGSDGSITITGGIVTAYTAPT